MQLDYNRANMFVRRFRNFQTNEMLSLFLTENRIIYLIWNIHEKNTDYGYRYNVFIISSYMSPYIALKVRS